MIKLVVLFPSHESGDSKLQWKKGNFLIGHPSEEKEKFYDFYSNLGST